MKALMPYRGSAVSTHASGRAPGVPGSDIHNSHAIVFAVDVFDPAALMAGRTAKVQYAPSSLKTRVPGGSVDDYKVVPGDALFAVVKHLDQKFSEGEYGSTKVSGKAFSNFANLVLEENESVRFLGIAATDGAAGITDSIRGATQVSCACRGIVRAYWNNPKQGVFVGDKVYWFDPDYDTLKNVVPKQGTSQTKLTPLLVSTTYAYSSQSIVRLANKLNPEIKDDVVVNLATADGGDDLIAGYRDRYGSPMVDLMLRTVKRYAQAAYTFDLKADDGSIGVLCDLWKAEIDERFMGMAVKPNGTGAVCEEYFDLVLGCA